MQNTSLDQAVIQTMNELMRASSDCAEFDPAMSAKFAMTAKDLGRDLGIALVKPEVVDEVDDEPKEIEPEDDDETRELLYLLDLQRKAVSQPELNESPKGRLNWLGLDAWSRW